MKIINLSVVIPVYECSEVPSELHQRLSDVLYKITDSYEIILVNEACPNDAWVAIEELAEIDFSDPLSHTVGGKANRSVSPHRKNLAKPATQDGCALRRYRRRWKVERTINWLFNFRRLVVPFERYSHLILGFAQLACVFTLFSKL